MGDFLIESLKGWVITICTAIIFITAVEMILPSGSIKKYAKFVLGLILITVLIKPFILIFDKKYDISAYVNNASLSFEKNYENTDISNQKEDNLKNTIDVFKRNLDTTCQTYLKQEYPDNYCEVNSYIIYDNIYQTLEIKNLEVYIKQSKIEPIKKVMINNKEETENKKPLNNDIAKNIAMSLSQKFEISKELIKVYKK